MKFNLPINNFASGEWSPKMAARTDTQEYAKSCEEVTNMFIQMQGGAQYRGNTMRKPIATDFAGDMSDELTGNYQPTYNFKLIPYKNSNPNLSTILCIYGNGLCIILTNDTGVYVDLGANTSMTGWKPQDTQYQQVGDLLFLTNITGLHKPKVFWFHSSAGNPFKPGGVNEYRIDDIDRDYITTSPWKTIPFGPVEALSSNVTITSPATTTVNTDQTFTASAAYFTSGMVGKYLRLANGTTVDGIVRIKTITNSTNAVCTILRTMTGSLAYGATGNPTAFWQISDWGDDVGWPKTVTAFQGRVIYGGNNYKTDTIWGSRISNIFDFQEVPDVITTGVAGFASAAFTADNSRPFTLTPNTAQSSSIVALSSSKTLNIHTDALEIVAYGSGGALGPVNVVFDSSSSFGASPVQPVRVNNYSTYVQANGYKIRDLTYNFSEDQYKSQDLGFTAEHLFLRTQAADIDVSVSGLIAKEKFPIDDIQEIIRYEGRSSMLFCKTRQGKLFYVTLDRDYAVNAWGRVVIGTDTIQTAPYDSAPKVLSLTVDPRTNKIAMLVDRTFNSVRTCVWEELQDPWEYANSHATSPDHYPDVNPGVYLDCAWPCYNQFDTAITAWQVDPTSGALTAKFPGATVSVIADGKYIGEITLGTDQPGVFTLSRPATEVWIGYKYPGKIITSGIEVGGQVGLPVGRIKRIDEMVIRLHNTGSAKIGTNADTMEELVIREQSQLGSEPTSYFSGDKVVVFPGGYERKLQVIIEQHQPYPLFVVSVAARGVTYD